jgi:hypothetical protein
MTAHGERLNRIIDAMDARTQEMQRCRDEGGEYQFVTRYEGPEIDSARERLAAAEAEYTATFTVDGPRIVQVIKNNLPGVRGRRRRALARKAGAIQTINGGVRSLEGNQELYWLEIASGLQD